VSGPTGRDTRKGYPCLQILFLFEENCPFSTFLLENLCPNLSVLFKGTLGQEGFPKENLPVRRDRKGLRDRLGHKFSNLSHPFSSLFFFFKKKGRKRQKKAGKGYQVSFPSENLPFDRFFKKKKKGQGRDTRLEKYGTLGQVRMDTSEKFFAIRSFFMYFYISIMIILLFVIYIIV